MKRTTLALALMMTVPIQDAFAETFRWHSGFFRKEGALWVEYPAYNAAGIHFTFEEIFRSSAHVVLYDRSRALAIRIPANGGASFVTVLNRDNSWGTWHFIVRQP